MNIFVIAFKFNDIFYAQSIPEFEKASKRILIKFVSKNFSQVPFPREDLFSKVYSMPINAEKISVSIPAILFRVSRLLREIGQKKRNILITSNIELIITRFIAKRRLFDSIILLEDGLMNYYYPIKKSIGLKKVVEFFLNINFDYIKEKISCTYLNNPDLAVYFFGRKIKFPHIGFPESSSLAHKLSNKKLFIGGGYFENLNYRSKFNIIEYLKEFENVDYFIPHHFDTFPWSDTFETIDLQSEQSTLEMIFHEINNISIYGFGTSVQLNALFRDVNCNIVFIEYTNTNDQNVAFEYIKRKSIKLLNVDFLIEKN